MRAVIQRVSSAKVDVKGETIGEIGPGLLALIGVESGDTDSDAAYIADKVAGMRVFEDSEGKMNLPLASVGGEVLAVSQFTLLGDCRRGRRPGFSTAADPESGNRLYRKVVELLVEQAIPVATGQFQADMQVALVNDGPVTILLDSRKLF